MMLIAVMGYLAEPSAPSSRRTASAASTAMLAKKSPWPPMILEDMVVRAAAMSRSLQESVSTLWFFPGASAH